MDSLRMKIQSALIQAHSKRLKGAKGDEHAAKNVDLKDKFEEKGGIGLKHIYSKADDMDYSEFAKKNRKMITDKRMHNSAKMKHPGFKSVQSKIQREGYSKKIAGAILAARTRSASASAHKANPRLNRVKG